jgi:hypothetical protein
MGAKTVLWCREKFPFMALWLVFLTIPLAISLTKYAAIIFLITFLWSGYWRQLRPNIFVLTIAIIFIINMYDLFHYHLAANDYEPVRHIWYLWFLPLVAVMP